MKEWLNKMTNKNKRVVIAVSILILGVGVSLAWMIPRIMDGASKKTNISANSIDELKFSVTPEGGVSLNPNQNNLTQSGNNLVSDVMTARASLVKNDIPGTPEIKFNYYVYVKINSDFVYTTPEKHPEIIMTVTDPNNQPVTSIEGLDAPKTIKGVTGFDVTNFYGILKIADLHEIKNNDSNNPTLQDWKFKFYFINLDTNQKANASHKMKATVLIQKDVYTPGILENIVTTGTGLYHHKGYVDVYGYSHDAGDGSYRYAGANPNNYICIGKPNDQAEIDKYNACKAGNTDNDYLYRIIGIFDGKLKVIKSSPLKLPDGNIANIKWNSVAENIWNQSTLYKGLNGIEIVGDNKPAYDYYNIILKPLVEGKIIDSSAKWYIDGHDTPKITPKEMHDAEIKKDNPNTITAPIGLMYAHDYGYGASSNNWTTTLYKYSGTAKNENWLYLGVTEWLITRYSSASYSAFGVYSSGFDYYYNVTNGFGVRPVYYLVSDTKISNGDGSPETPYQI